jgi:hypothetical protein
MPHIGPKAAGRLGQASRASTDPRSWRTLFFVNRARLFERALALPQEDRLELAAELLASSPPPGLLAEGSPALAEAIAQRIESVRSGKTKSIPAMRALARLRRPKSRR